MTVTLLDAILIAIMLVSGLLAMVRGFSREILSVLSWVAAAAAAYMFYEQLTPFMSNYIHNEKVALVASAATIFFGTLIVVSFITLKIADFIIDSRIGAIDRTLGFLFGAARGLLLVVVAMVFFNWLTPPQSGNQPPWVAQARSKPLLDELGNRLVSALPDDPQETIRERFGTPAPNADGAPAGENPAAEQPGSIEDAIRDNEEPADAPAN
ncbi:CvpA family protein [Aureimonas sp. AU22]|jgi:membrane protein required for colicin V production|uniref:CvpA family protein n=1 Tax=Aureimonas sp. AU22 TaxID=1638162 RepID=UPI0007846A74|nr:CvpA family protein [Aureimonas sp. AU22]